eukprot:9487587-Pyramimonas_sp.AAC.2
MFASVGPEQCVSSELSGAIYLEQSLRCTLYNGKPTVQSMLLNPCGAILRGAIYVGAIYALLKIYVECSM